MLKLSEIISLPIINLFELKIEGTVENVYIHPTTRKITYLKIYNEERDEYSVLELKNIYKIGKDAVLIANSNKLTLFENKELILEKMVCPLNSLCFDLSGNILGKINEINIEKNTLHSIETEQNSYPATNIYGLSNAVTLIGNNKVKINRFSPKTKFSFSKAKTAQKVKIESAIPQKEITNYEFLLKRKLTKDIKNENGEIIAKNGVRVTTNLINKLKCYSKLKELTLNSK